MTREEAIKLLRKLRETIDRNNKYGEAEEMAIQALEQEPCEDWYDVPSDEMTLEQARQAVKNLRKKVAEHLEQEPKTRQYEKHIDHTDCIWYGSDGGCPVTCSQYRDGWNDAMDYIFKNGKGYQPYRRDG